MHHQKSTINPPTDPHPRSNHGLQECWRPLTLARTGTATANGPTRATVERTASLTSALRHQEQLPDSMRNATTARADAAVTSSHHGAHAPLPSHAASVWYAGTWHKVKDDNWTLAKPRSRQYERRRPPSGLPPAFSRTCTRVLAGRRHQRKPFSLGICRHQQHLVLLDRRASAPADESESGSLLIGPWRAGRRP